MGKASSTLPQLSIARKTQRKSTDRRVDDTLFIHYKETAGAPPYPRISLNGINRRLSPSAKVVFSSTSANPSAQAALRSTPELWFG